MPHNLRQIKDSTLPNICWVKLKINAVKYILVLRNKNLKEQEMYILVSSTTGAKNLVPALKIKHLWVNCCKVRRLYSYQQKDLIYSSTILNCTEPYGTVLQVIISSNNFRTREYRTCLLKSNVCTFEVSQVI